MTIKTLLPRTVFILTLLCGNLAVGFIFSQTPVSTQSTEEIKELFAIGKYSLALEKSLDILNTKEDKLTPEQAALLYYYIGMSYKKNQNNELAVDYLKKIELKFPASEYVKLSYLELSEIFKSDYFQREAILEKLFKKFPKTPEAVDAGIELSREYIRLKNYRKALPVLETIVHVWTQGDEKPESYMLAAVAYAGSKDYIEAIDFLMKAENLIKPMITGNPYYLMEAGKIFYYSLNFKKAVEYLELLFNTYSDNKNIPEAAILLAQSYEREQKPFLGAIFLVKAIQKKPEQKFLHALYLNLGRILNTLDQRDLEKIKRNYPLLSNSEKLLTFVKNNSANFEDRKTAAILLSDEYKKNKDFGKALDNYYKFLGSNRDQTVEKLFKENLDTYIYDLGKKNDHEALFNAWTKLKNRKSFLSADNLLQFGEIFYKMKLYSNAEEIYRHLLKYKMYSLQWAQSLHQLARIFVQTGRYRECLDLYDKIQTAEEPLLSEFEYYKALCLQNLKKTDEYGQLVDKLTVLDPSMEFDPTSINSFRFRIFLLKIGQLNIQGKFDEALDLSLKLEGVPDIPENDRMQLKMLKGESFYRKNEYENALAALNIVSASRSISKTEREWVLFRITGIYRIQGLKEEEKKSFNQLKELNPSSFWIRQLEKNVR